MTAKGTERYSKGSLGCRMWVLQRAQAKLRQVAQDAEELELADAVGELHTELWFWQPAMGYTDNARVQVIVTGEKRPRSQEDGFPWWRRLLSIA